MNTDLQMVEDLLELMPVNLIDLEVKLSIPRGTLSKFMRGDGKLTPVNIDNIIKYYKGIANNITYITT